MQLPVHNMTIRVQNEDAQMPLVIPLHLVCNTDDETLYRNIEENSRLPREWVGLTEAHDGVAVLVGGGPSLADTLREIRDLEAAGATIFALNGAARYLNDRGILADYQVILDPRRETADLVGPAIEHLFASQCDPLCFERAPRAQVWHLEIGEIEKHFPPERTGGYVMIGGAATVGVSATCLTYAMGFREIHCFGYDSSRPIGGPGHAYRQPMNDGEPLCLTEFDGKVYECSLTMKLQTERFIGVARRLKQSGCDIQVHGSGLLPDMYNRAPREMSEAEKYELMWAYREYREYSPGEREVDQFLAVVSPTPGSTILDFGCGTGRASVKLAQAGFRPLLLDFADNCRDTAALALPFARCDLSDAIPALAPYGLCTDVMEHLPPEQVEATIRNIMGAAPIVFFQISTVPDDMGDLIGMPLHLTVQPHAWWREQFVAFGYAVRWEEEGKTASRFLITNEG